MKINTDSSINEPEYIVEKRPASPSQNNSQVILSVSGVNNQPGVSIEPGKKYENALCASPREDEKVDDRNAEANKNNDNTERRNVICNDIVGIKSMRFHRELEHFMIQPLKGELEKLNREIIKYELKYSQSNCVTVELKEDFYPPRRGEHCKIYALALVEAFYADSMAIKKIPLLAEKGNVESIRKIAKKFNSVQGEVLQSSDLKKIAEYMGYEVELINLRTSSELSEYIEKYIGDSGLITFFRFNPDMPYGMMLDSSHIESGQSEHAAVISGFDKKRNICTLNDRKGALMGVPIEDLFLSGNGLLTTRSQESYRTDFASKRSLCDAGQIESRGRHAYKYPVILEESDNNAKFMTTIVPTEASGFKALLMRLKPNLEHERWKATTRAKSDSSLK
ncbi:hypothetical protein NYP80_10175 [Erwinia pyrifoliae]|uniref:hypothetical protein n=1 Tax=Erwinia pyrifoliae TaxID=79967 RepID=UPI0021BE9DA1|nr:hypothetical protein [Erwinia pyrifoliae]UXK10727.1 hypothetical protein NYP80_10175 [Erwinia pyrifoliae]